jgi:hypothetical protein
MGKGKSKLNLVIISVTSLAAGIIIGAFIISIINVSYQSILENEISKYSHGKALITIDNEKIGKEFFDRRVSLFKEHIATKRTGSDPMMEDRLLRKIIDNYIVLKEAEKSKLFTSKKASDYLWLYLEEAMVNYYLDFMVNLKRKKKIKLSEKELNDFYLKNKEMFDRKRISREKAIEISKKQLSTINKKMADKNRSTARIVELGRLKKGKKIKINREYYKQGK